MPRANSLLVILTLLFFSGPAENSWAGPGPVMITGGKGNKPLPDPGWPKGAADVFNWKTRIAWWEGPPFGGGQWHSECKGSKQELERLLELFAKIDLPKKQVLVKDGIGYSFWLDPNQTKRADRETKIDWEFTIWQTDRWKMQQGLPAELRAVSSQDEHPPAILTVYGASIRWNEVTIPEGIEVIDNRLEAHGFKLADGRVLEGTVSNETGEPLAAKVLVQRVQPRETGGYEYTDLNALETDQNGHWVVKDFGTERCRILVSAPGYASRILGYVKYDRQPGWTRWDTQLRTSTQLRGSVVNADGQPLSDAKVYLTSVTVDEQRYELAGGPLVELSDGEFTLDGLPQASKIGLRATLAGHIMARQEVQLPSDGVELKLTPAGSLTVNVEFDQPPPTRYVIQLEPEGGNAVGKWGGSANIDEERSYTFQNIPPGTYVLTGKPNPGSVRETTEPLTIKIRGGDNQKVTLKAK